MTVIHRKRIYLGNYDYFGTGSLYKCYADIELRLNKEGKLCFAASGQVGKYCFGQIIDTIYDKMPNEKTKEIYELWKRWHNNNLHAGCIHQREFENEPYEKHKGEYCPICNYIYGTDWMYEEIPADVIERIKAL